MLARSGPLCAMVKAARRSQKTRPELRNPVDPVLQPLGRLGGVGGALHDGEGLVGGNHIAILELHVEQRRGV